MLGAVVKTTCMAAAHQAFTSLGPNRTIDATREDVVQKI